VVIEPGMTPLERYQLLTEDELLDAQDEYGEDASAPASAPRRSSRC
jgi:DNA-directed RNA polymerase subunit beta'